MPESKYILFHTVAALAKSNKSREATDLMHQAESLAEQFPDSPIPLHLRNAPTKLMKGLGYSKDYKWESGFKHEHSNLPEEIIGKIKNQ